MTASPRKPLKGQIIGLRRIGKTYREIAERTGASLGYVSSILTTCGLTNPNYHTSILEENAVRRLYRDGATMREIGERFGVSAVAVHKFMRRHGIEARAYTRKPDEARIKLIRDLADAGLTQAEIGAQLGVSGVAVSAFMDRHGIAPSFGIARKKAGAVIDAGPVSPGTTPHSKLPEAEPLTTHPEQVQV